MCGADRHLDLSTASLPASAKPHSTIGHLIVKSLSHSWAPHHHEGAAHHKFPNQWRMRRIFFDANDWGAEPNLKDGCKVATQVALEVSPPAGLKTLGDQR